MRSGPKPRPIRDRFYAKFVAGDGCWEWRGARLPTGYGQFFTASNPKAYAHRVSWEIHHGPIPDGLLVLHRCDNPSCVNPEHLFVGTQQANMADCVAKNRQARGEVVARRGEKNGAHTKPDRVMRGERHPAHQHPERMQGAKNPRARLTEDQVRAIRAAVAGGATKASLGRQYGVNEATIGKIARRQLWPLLP